MIIISDEITFCSFPINISDFSLHELVILVFSVINCSTMINDDPLTIQFSVSEFSFKSCAARQEAVIYNLCLAINFFD